jgi:WD40-like Beta Propeller Repeat.
MAHHAKSVSTGRSGFRTLPTARTGHSWLIVQGGEQWLLLHVDASGRTAPLISPQFWMYSSAVSPDGKRIAYTSNMGQGNIWMLQGF